MSSHVVAEIRQELAGESYDEELFGIFIQQSGNNFSEISALAGKITDPATSGELLERCNTCLENLRSSANYMGYANLVSLYDNWQAELSAAISKAENGEDVSLDFIPSYLDLLADAIPELEDFQGAGAETATEKAKAAEEDDGGVELMAIDEDAIKEEISGEVYDEELFAIFTQQVKTNINVIRKSLADFQESADKAALFDSCAKSLANLSQAGTDASEALKEFKAFAAQAKQSTSQLSLDLRDAAQAVINSSEQISNLLQHLNQAIEQVNQGQGTAGKILYDPELYEEMLSATENLNQAVQELRALLSKWSRDGMKVDW